MGLGEGIREVVADVGVQNADINTGAITNDKMAGTCGRFFATTITGSATSGYVSLFVCTSAATFFLGILQITAAGTSGDITICNSAGTALIEAKAISAAAATYMSSSAALTARVVEVGAGNSLCALYTTGTATANLRGKLFVGYINTPS